MGYMNWFDYAVILAYLVILLIIGFYLRARASRSLDDYFLAGRSLPWWALGISGMASWLDLTGTMLVTSLLFVMGPKGLLLEFRGGACLVLVFLMVYIGKWQRRSRLMTNAEWMIFRFGDGFGGTFARLSAVLAAIVGTVGMLAYAIKGVGLFLSMFLPYTPIVCAAIMVAVTCIYLVQSGFYGVVVTDVFQSVCILVGVIFIVWLAVSKIAGVDVAALALQVTGQTDWTATIPAWQEKFPKGYEQYDYLTLIVLFFLTKTIFQSMGVTGDNRYFAARDERESGLLAMTSGWSMVMRWPLMMGAALLGLLIIQASFPDQSVLGQAAAVIHQYYCLLYTSPSPRD
ncbi:MAG: sodium:solute symporter, partial [Negativicutes bacterium]|nr:sodium:solute symporter [Negativicutes bacterium]